MSTLKDLSQNVAKAAVNRALGGNAEDADDPEHEAKMRKRKLLAIALISGVGLIVGAAVLMKIWWYLVFGAGAAGLLGAGYIYYKPKMKRALEEKKVERLALEAKKTEGAKAQSAQERFDAEFAALKARAETEPDA